MFVYQYSAEQVTKYYNLGQVTGMSKDGVYYTLVSDQVSSTALVVDASGNKVAETRYFPFGEERYTWGSQPTDKTYNWQRSEDFGLMDYNARYYSPYLNQFAQPDTIIPDPYNPLSWNRYAYVDNNPILFLDPSGHEKVVIIYGMYDGTNSFQAAAETQYRTALAQGYIEDEILMVQVRTEDEFLASIAHNDIGEIEQVHIFSHGWGIDGDGTLAGGLQLSKPNNEEEIDLTDLTGEDLSQNYSNRFNEDSQIYMNACSTAQGTFPQEMSDAFNTTVHAYDKPMKFFWLANNMFFLPYGGKSDEPIPGLNVVLLPINKKIFYDPTAEKIYIPQ